MRQKPFSRRKQAGRNRTPIFRFDHYMGEGIYFFMKPFNSRTTRKNRDLRRNAKVCINFMNKNRRIEVFQTFEQENDVERRRFRRMSPRERWREFSLLQERRWGAGWTSVPIVKKVKYEKVKW